MEDFAKTLMLLTAIYNIAKEILIIMFLISGYKAFSKYLHSHKEKHDEIKETNKE